LFRFEDGVADTDTRFSLGLLLFETYPEHGIDRKFLIPILFEEDASHSVLEMKLYHEYLSEHFLERGLLLYIVDET
jgi:hypothetical protein